MMRPIRLLAAVCAVLLLTGCSNDLLPAHEAVGSWTSRVTYNSGLYERTVYNNLSLQADGRFIWSETSYGNGAGQPDAPLSRFARRGHYRLRGRFLEFRTEVMESSAAPADTPERVTVRRPEWSGDMYRMDVDGDLLTLRFTVAPADAPEDVTLRFERDRPID